MKRIYYILILVTLFSSRAAIASAEEITAVLTLDRAVELALENSDDLKINNENLQKLKNRYKEVRSSIFPQVDGTLGATRYIESPPGEASMPSLEDWETRLGIGVSQMLWAFGKARNAIRLAENYINLEKYAAGITKNELTFAVKQLYYSMLLAREMVEIASDSHKNAIKNESALKARFKKGRVSRANNIKMEADTAGRVPRVLEAEKSRDLAAVTFKDVLGFSADTKIILQEYLKEDFPEFDSLKLKTEMLNSEPVLMVYREKLRLADVQIRLRKSNFYPTLTGFLSYGYVGSGEDIIPDDMDAEVVAGISLNYNIWDSGAKKNSHKQAINDKNIAELEYHKKERALNVELASVLSEYKALIKTYEAHRKALDLAETSYSIALSSFRSGVVSQTMLNDAELQLTGAKMEAVTTLYNINILIARIEKLVSETEKQ